MKKIGLVILFVTALLVALQPFAQAQSANPQATLNQYISDLQKNPGDYALREKIIRHVQTMKPKPAIPEESERRMARGSAAVKGAQNKQDFLDAAAEFEKAALAAPWLPAVYYNLGITQDKAGKYREAIQSLKLYLLAAPDASDAKAVKNLIYEIEYRQEKAAKEPPRQVSTAPKQNPFEDLLGKIDGRRYTSRDKGYKVLLDVRGRAFVQGLIENDGSYRELSRTEIRGREFTEPVYSTIPAGIARIVERYWSISESGDSITLRWRWSGGEIEQLIYLWQR